MCIKIVPFALLLSLFALTARAQTFNFYLTGGGTMAQIDGDNMAGLNKIGPTGGVGVRYEGAERSPWKGGFEILYNQKGSRRIMKDGVWQPTAPWHLVRLNYIQVPVYVSVYATRELSLSGGLAGGYYLGGVYQDVMFNQFDQTFAKPYELSGFGGLGYLLGDRFEVAARWEYSLLSIFDFRHSSLPYMPVYQQRMFNHTLSLLGRWYFNTAR